MEKIVVPLNIIVNLLRKIMFKIRESSISTPENPQEINHTDFVIHTVKDNIKVRNKYPFEIFARNELIHLELK